MSQCLHPECLVSRIEQRKALLLMADHYSTLGLTRTASEQDVKAAYRKMAKKFHPDKNLGNKERSTEMFKKVTGLSWSQSIFVAGACDSRRAIQAMYAVAPCRSARRTPC